MPAKPVYKEMADFLETWTETDKQNKRAFVRLWDYLEAKGDVVFDFKGRPGVSYSLRASRPGQEKPLFVMVDIIDDDPQNRWLSVCFYGDMIKDPDERGDLVPQGILGEDGYCFDLEKWDEGLLSYLEGRIDEAFAAAGGAKG